MKRSNMRSLLLLAALTLAGLVPLAPPVHAQEEIVLSPLEVTSGVVVDDVYFTGAVTVESSFEGSGFTVPPLTGSVSLDGGATWAATPLQETLEEIATRDTTVQAGLSNNWDMVPVAGGGRFYAVGGQPTSLTRVDAQGNTVSTRTLNSSVSFGFSPALAALSATEYVALWGEWNAAVTGQILWAQRVDSDGNPIGAVIRVVEATGFGNNHFKVGPVTGGGFVVVWSQTNGVNTTTSVHARIYNGNGTPRTNAFRVNTYTGSNNDGIMTAALANGQILFAWVTASTGPGGVTARGAVVARRFNANGQAQTAEYFLHSASNQVNNPRLVELTGQTFAAAWNCVPPGVLITVCGRVLDASGNTSGAEFIIAPGPQNAILDVAATPDGGYRVTWFQVQGPGPVGFYTRKYLESTAGPSSFVMPWQPGVQFVGFQLVEEEPDTIQMFHLVRIPGNPLQGIFIKEMAPVSALSASLAGITHDVDIQFRVERAASGETWLSPSRAFRYLDPNLGAGGTISYPDGFTNAAAVTLAINRPDGPYSAAAFSQRSADLAGGACGTFADWSAYAPESTQTTQKTVGVADGACYQFKWQVTNQAGASYEYTSGNTVKSDRTPPTLEVLSDTVIGAAMAVNANVSDAASGLATHVYSLNAGAGVTVTGNPFSIPLVDGANLIVLTATDAAGNQSTAYLTTAVDLTPPSINLVGFDPSVVYDNGAVFPLYFTQGLTDLVLLVDGVERPDLLVFVNGTWQVLLTGLAPGAHSVEVRGKDAGGNTVTKTAAINVDPAAFSLAIVSPQPRLYEVNNVTIAVQASRPTTRVWFTLNGGPEREDFVLGGLPNGNHQIIVHAQSTTGQTAQKTLSFSVQLGVPTLTVHEPVAGATYAGNAVRVNFASDAPVTYVLDGVSGSVSPGQFLTVPADGEHTLVLTATHPLSGNPTSQAVAFRTDTVEPEVTLVSPQPILYAYDQVPIEVQANKPLQNVQYLLNGQPVSALTGLGAGSHTFAYSASDAAGRLIQRTVQFTVASLSIVAPLAGEQVVSNVYPVQVPFQYEADGPFQALSVALDTNPAQLITQPENTVIPLQTTAGTHEVTLRGQMNAFSIGKRASFEIGSKNVSAGPGSLDYTYANCDAAFTCDVNAVVKVRNTGTYDITEPFSMRFDQVRGVALATQTVTVPALARGERTSIALAPFRANLGDRLLLTVDPGATLAGERTDDNGLNIAFEAGSITATANSLSAGNTLLEGVSLINSVGIATAGPVARVEIQAGPIAFVDDTPENGFNAQVDFGLLSRDNPCVTVRAIGSNGVTLDSRRWCYNVRRLGVAGFTAQLFPWSNFADGGSRVVMSQVVPTDYLKVLMSFQLRTALASVSVSAVVEANGGVVYRVLLNSALLALHLDGQGLPAAVDGTQGIVITSVDAMSHTCNGEGVIPIVDMNAKFAFYTTLLQQMIADALEQAREDIDDLNLNFEQLIDQAWEDSIYSEVVFNPKLQVLEIIKRQFMNDGALIGGLFGQSVRNDMGDLFDKLLALPFNQAFGTRDVTLNKMTSGVPKLAVTTSVDLKYSVSECRMVLNDVDAVDLVFKAQIGVDAHGSVKVSTGGQKLDVGAGIGAYELGAVMGVHQKLHSVLPGGDLLNLGLSPSGDGIFIGAIGARFKMRVSNIKITLPFQGTWSTDVALVDNTFFVGPSLTTFDTSLSYHKKIATAELKAFLGASIGDFDLLNINKQYKARAYLNLDGMFKSDDVAGVQQFSHGRSRMSLKVETKTKDCFIICGDWTDWDEDAKLSMKDPKSGGYTVEGAPYTDADVTAVLDAQEPVDVGQIDELAELAIYYTLTGQPIPAAEALSCSVFSAQNAALVPPALYSRSGGVCHAVPNPDANDAGPFFTDAGCTTPVSYERTAFFNYCRKNYLPPAALTEIGDASQIVPDNDAQYASLGNYSKWTLAHGPRLDVLALSPAGNGRPYEKHIEYREANGCRLEMRVFKKDVYATNLKPAMVIHGGSWTTRSAGTTGLLPLVSQFTDRGYVVFAPYHRQLADSEAPAACQNANGGQIIADVDAALTWVKANGPTLGADAAVNVTLLGQSSGAHLAGVLALDRPGDIRKTVLMYPPVDFAHGIHQWKTDAAFRTDFATGMEKIAAFLGKNLADLDATDEATLLSDPLVIQSSLPARIAAGQPTGPMFIVHGNADTVVPVEMATRVCDALSGDPLDTLSTDGAAVACGPDGNPESVLHVVDGADHALDLKCFSGLSPELAEALGLPGLETGCPPGSTAGEEVVRQALQQALVWLDAP